MRLKNIMIHALFGVLGGLAYVGVELLWRGHSHWTMALLGGLCFVAIGLLNEGLYPPSLPVQMLMGAAIVTVAELLTGLIVNVWLGLDVWDYSGMPLNLWGQICLPYSCAWVLLAGVAVKLEDWMHMVADKFGKTREIQKYRR